MLGLSYWSAAAGCVAVMAAGVFIAFAVTAALEKSDAKGDGEAVGFMLWCLIVAALILGGAIKLFGA